MKIELDIDWWHLALLGVAVAGIIAALLGWEPGLLLSLLGMGGSAERERRRRSVSPTIDEPSPDDYQRPEIDDDESDPHKPTPDSAADGVDADYWTDLHERGERSGD